MASIRMHSCTCSSFLSLQISRKMLFVQYTEFSDMLFFIRPFCFLLSYKVMFSTSTYCLPGVLKIIISYKIYKASEKASSDMFGKLFF